MSVKTLTYDPETKRKVYRDVPDAAEVSVIPGADKIVRADGTGKIAAGWVGSVAFSALPVAANGEVSASKVVAADDSRLGNPPVGGDLAGTAAAAAVIKIQGRAVANTAPANGQALVWNQTAQQYEPATVGGGAGNATSLQGNPVAAVMPAEGQALIWNGSAWTPGAGGGGGDSVGSALLLFERYS